MKFAGEKEIYGAIVAEAASRGDVEDCEDCMSMRNGFEPCRQEG